MPTHRRNALTLGSFESIAFSPFGTQSGTPLRHHGEVIRAETTSISSRSIDQEVKKELLSKLKTQHLTKTERDYLHFPASDWYDTGKGEVCKNACTLEVSDIISKYIKGR